MSWPDIINSIGLGFDIFGVIILFKFGLPSEFHTPPKLLLEKGLSKKKKRKIIESSFGHMQG